MVRMTLSTGWIHQRCEIPTSTANTGRFGSTAVASGGSRKLT